MTEKPFITFHSDSEETLIYLKMRIKHKEILSFNTLGTETEFELVSVNLAHEAKDSSISLNDEVSPSLNKIFILRNVDVEGLGAKL